MTPGERSVMAYEEAWARLAAGWRALWTARAECLMALAFVGGWLLVTAGIAALTSRIAWLFSLGLLAISLGGWKPFARFVYAGLYVLTREENGNG
jgi:hypothetical protein